MNTMCAALVVRTPEDLDALRRRLAATELHARRALAAILDTSDFLRRLKFERIGCDPFDEHDAQNLAEQIDQHATYEAALDAVARLMDRHPGCSWTLAPGARGSGHDIVSSDGTVAAEVFAAVKPSNNDKLKDDIAKVSAFGGPHKYVFFRSPARPAGEDNVQGVRVISLGM